MNSNKIPRDLKILWYDDAELKESTIDISQCTTWELLRKEVAFLTSFVGSKLSRVRFQNRDGFDLEEKFLESNFFEEVVSHYYEILLVDPENTDPLHGMIRMQLDQLD
jgi:hypothetical protein